MPATHVTERFIESRQGRFSGFLLALLWIYAMTTGYEQSYQQVPVLCGMGLLLLTFLWALAKGQRLLRLPWLAWVSLGIGTFFALRAATSYSQLEGWGDLGLILSCMVFYVAGIYYGQEKNAGHGLCRILLIALLLNAVYWFIARHTEIGAWIWAQAETGLLGPHRRPTSLFLYKNFAGVFFIITGGVLLWRSLWLEKPSAKTWLLSLLGLGGIILSFFCGTRTGFVLTPILLLGGWLLWAGIRLLSERRMNWVDLVLGLISLAGLIFIIYDVLVGKTVVKLLTNFDAHLRTWIWRDITLVMRDAPLWGFGAGASQWEIVPIFNSWNSPNFAHNEYLQVIMDYGLIGIIFLFFILSSHVIKAGRAFVAEETPSPRRIQISTVLLMGALIALYAFFDFAWHQMALATGSAFLLGVMASPSRKKKKHSTQLTLIQAEGNKGKSILALVACLILAGLTTLISKQAFPWRKQWEYSQLHDGYYTEAQRAKLLKEALLTFPDGDIYNNAIRTPEIYYAWQWADFEAILQRILETNPKQYYAVVALAELWTQREQYEKAEALMREKYIGDGMVPTNLTRWPSFYAYNLLYWGQNEYTKGNYRKALSLWDHMFHIRAKYLGITNSAWRKKSPTRTELQDRHGFQKTLLHASKETKFLRKLKIKPDDSWKEPSSSGKRALYQKLQTH